MLNKNFYDSFIYDWWKNLDKVIFFLFVTLIILGIFFSLVSTSLIASSKLGTNNYYFFLRHLIYIFLGFILIISFSAFRESDIYKIATILFIIFFVSLLIVPIFGTETLLTARAFLEAFIQDPSIELPINLPCCCFGVSSSKHSYSAKRRDYPIAGLLPAGHKALELAIEKVASGYRTLKWKVGVLDLQDEQAILYDLFKKSSPF